jgi:hypothetical protein
MAYYTNSGPLSGPLLSRAGYFAIEVLPGREVRAPIGVSAWVRTTSTGPGP